MKLLMLIALSLFPLKETAEPYIDPRVRPIVEEFLCKAYEAGVEVPIQNSFSVVVVNAPDSPVLGMAHGMFHDDTVMISINVSSFSLGEDSLKWIVYHELLHDIFNLTHNSTEIMTTGYDFDTDYSRVDRALERALEMLSKC